MDNLINLNQAREYCTLVATGTSEEDASNQVFGHYDPEEISSSTAIKLLSNTTLDTARRQAYTQINLLKTARYNAALSLLEQGQAILNSVDPTDIDSLMKAQENQRRNISLEVEE